MYYSTEFKFFSVEGRWTGMYSQRTEALQLAYSGYGEYKGVIYFATKDKKEIFVELTGCYIDKVEENLGFLLSKRCKCDLYITNNAFKNLKGRKDNLFSYNSIVIDIDCHSAEVSPSQAYTITHSFAMALCKDLGECPMMNLIHYTGRGLQLWWCFEQVSNKLRFPYRITLIKFIERLKNFLEKHPEYSDLEVDPTSKKETGYFRAFDTYNTSAGKESLVVVQNPTPYKLQNLIDAVKDVRTEYISDGEEAHKNTTEKPSWTKFSIQNRKRMLLIESLIKDRAAPKGKESRNNFIYVYYNCSKGIYSTEMAQQKAKRLNEMFKEPLPSLDYIFKEIDTLYNKSNPYRFKNSTLIEWFDITPEEQDKYNFKPAKLHSGGFKGLIQNRSRDEESKARRKFKEDRIISLYSSGLTQAEVAEESGYSISTVKRLLKKKNISRKEERIRMIQCLKEDGYMQVKVAEILEISVRTVKTYWNYIPSDQGAEKYQNGALYN